MRLPSISPLWLWAARDILRHPLEAILLVFSLGLLIAITGAALLLTQALSHTAADLVEKGPSLVVRRITAGGWAPLPVQESLEAVRGVPGVVRARERVWGAADGPEGPVTVVGVDTAAGEILQSNELSRVPGPGEAVVGRAAASNPEESSEPFIRLSSHKTMEFKIIDVLDTETGIVTHDLVLLHEDDVRALLDIPPGFAGDLAVDVFHREEEAAIVPDLAAAFPWPVRITTRTETVGSYTAGWARRGGLVVMTVLPALLAVALIVAATVRDRLGRRFEVGLLKALGWTSADVVKLQMFRAVLIGLTAAALGMLAAYALVFGPGSRWVGIVILGWRGRVPNLVLDSSGAVLVLLEITALLIVPFLAATLWPALRGAASDPRDLFDKGEG